jgi:N-acyl-L-homoserine lactone synthetase
MALVIRPQHRDRFRKVLADMHRLRHRVFVERLGWQIPGDDGVHEIDQFDAGACLHLVALASDGSVAASSRLTPSLEPNVTCDVLQGQIDQPLPRAAHIVEISRQCVDHTKPEDVRRAAMKDLRQSQFELYKKHDWSHVLSVAYVRTIQPWIRAGGQVEVYGSPTVFPGDKEPSFAVLMSGTSEGDAVIERHVGQLVGMLMDPADDPSLIDQFGEQRAA